MTTRKKQHKVDLNDGTWELVREFPSSDIKAGLNDERDTIRRFLAKEINVFVEFVTDEDSGQVDCHVWAQTNPKEEEASEG